MNDSRPPMILEHYSVTQKSDQEVIHWMTQKFRNNVELIRRVRAVFKRYCFLWLCVWAFMYGFGVSGLRRMRANSRKFL